MHLPTEIELRAVDQLLPFARNSRTHSDAQIAQVAASIREFGWTCPVLIGTDNGIIAGHARVLAARRLKLEHVPVIVLDHLSDTQRRAYVIADNRLTEQGGWDNEVLRGELAGLQDADFDLEMLGFNEDELRALLAETEPTAGDPATEEADEDVPEPPAEPVSLPGDIWLIGKHRLICGDCRDYATVVRLFEGAKANLVITSPPYATQREYDPASGFKPVPPEEYVGWFRAVVAGVESVLAPDGSYFLNIKAHADEGERNLYVMDLVLAHRRQWGWRFVDEFCWRKTDNGVPGGWGNRFKNAWEPVYHFCRQQQIKFRPKSVGHESGDCFDYSPNNPKSTSGSGLLGTGPRGAAADGGKNQSAWQRSRSSLSDDSEGRHAGVARPSNVIEVRTESGQGSHSAPFPRALVEFFIKAFSDQGDVVFDPFMGSGTTMAAAELLDRIGYGAEISPAYCDVIIRRIMDLSGNEPVLEATAQSFADVAAARGVPVDQALNPKQQDSRAIKHHGPNPFYGSKRKAS